MWDASPCKWLLGDVSLPWCPSDLSCLKLGREEPSSLWGSPHDCSGTTGSSTVTNAALPKPKECKTLVFATQLRESR